MGTLDPDDVAPFEVTFRAGADVTEVPLIIDYRDSDGNPFSVTVPVSIENRTAEGEAAPGTLVPAVVVGVLVLAAGLAVLWYLRRRRR